MAKNRFNIGDTVKYFRPFDNLKHNCFVLRVLKSEYNFLTLVTKKGENFQLGAEKRNNVFHTRQVLTEKKNKLLA